MAYRPTKNPRIAFVPSDIAQEVILQMAETSGQSRASVVAELMNDLAPVIKGQIEAHQKIANRPQEARQYIQDLAEESRAIIAQAELALDKPKRRRKRKGATSGPT
jgi:putative cell wall-binding protein